MPTGLYPLQFESEANRVTAFAIRPTAPVGRDSRPRNTTTNQAVAATKNLPTMQNILWMNAVRVPAAVDSATNLSLTLITRTTLVIHDPPRERWPGAIGIPCQPFRVFFARGSAAPNGQGKAVWAELDPERSLGRWFPPAVSSSILAPNASESINRAAMRISLWANNSPPLRYREYGGTDVGVGLSVIQRRPALLCHSLPVSTIKKSSSITSG